MTTVLLLQGKLISESDIKSSSFLFAKCSKQNVQKYQFGAQYWIFEKI